jgi:large subunit ribosomal protein L17
MRHRKRQRKLGRTSAHRSALFRNQLASMVQNERIVTTLEKAKELRPILEKLVTLGKEDSVHHRRQAARSVSDRDLLKKLFEEISPRFSDRPGGYTRIIKLGPRRGDGAEMAILEFVDFERVPAPAPKGRKARKAAPEEETEETTPDTTEEETEGEAPKKKPAAKKKPAKKPAAKKPAAKKGGSTRGGAKKAGAAKKGGSSKKTSGSKKTTSKKSSAARPKK